MTRGLVPQEAIHVVRKETCPNCKGNRYIEIAPTKGGKSLVRCPHCGGVGYCVRMR